MFSTLRPLLLLLYVSLSSTKITERQRTRGLLFGNSSRLSVLAYFCCNCCFFCNDLQRCWGSIVENIICGNIPILKSSLLEKAFIEAPKECSCSGWAYWSFHVGGFILAYRKICKKRNVPFVDWVIINIAFS